MKTRHVTWSDSYDVINSIRSALREVKNTNNSIRVINCGRGIIILPDTDRTKDCTEGELIKALGLVKKYDGLHLNGATLENAVERKPVILRRSDDTPEWLSLTPDQWRLLNWLSKYDFFWDEVEIQEMQPTGFKEI